MATFAVTFGTVVAVGRGIMVGGSVRTTVVGTLCSADGTQDDRMNTVSSTNLLISSMDFIFDNHVPEFNISIS